MGLVPTVLTSTVAAETGVPTLLALVLTALPIIITLGILWWSFVWYENRRLGGRGQSALFRRALRSSEVPPGANTALWSRQLQRAERTDAKRGWKAWVPSAVIVALIVGVNVKSALEDADSGLGLALAVLAPLVLVSALVWWSAVAMRRGRRRRRALLAALTRQSL